MADRKAEQNRKTRETEVYAYIDLDGSGKSELDTGVGFLDHMLELFSKHGLFDLKIKASGDLRVDGHHVVEDIGIVLGQAMNTAFGDKASIRRYGSVLVPMDEALALAVVDVGGRPFFVSDMQFTAPNVGEMDTELFEEFFRALAFAAGINLHIKVLYGSNNHHIAEAVFKSFARSLSDAVRIDPRVKGIPSTKGVL